LFEKNFLLQRALPTQIHIMKKRMIICKYNHPLLQFSVRVQGDLYCPFYNFVAQFLACIKDEVYACPYTGIGIFICGFFKTFKSGSGKIFYAELCNTNLNAPLCPSVYQP